MGSLFYTKPFQPIDLGVLLITAISIILYTAKIYDPGSYIWLCTSALLAFKHREFPPYSVIFLFISTYTLATHPLLSYGINYSFWADFITIENSAKVILLGQLFTATLGISLKTKEKQEFYLSIKEYTRPSTPFYLICYAFCLFAMSNGLQGESLLSSGEYKSGVSKNTLFEYFIVPFFSLLYFQPRHISFQIATLILLIAYSLKGFAFGARIESLMAGMLYMYMSFNFFRRFSTLQLGMLFFSGFIFYSWISIFRSNFALALSFQGLAESLSIVIAKISSPIGLSQSYISTHAGDVTQATARIIGIADLGYLGSEKKLIGILAYVFNILSPTNGWPEYTRLDTYLSGLYQTGGGGFIFGYFYAWLSWGGPILSALFVSRSLNLSRFEHRLGAHETYALFILVTFPRWIAYNPVVLVKLCLVGVLFWLILSKSKRSLISLGYTKQRPNFIQSEINNPSKQ